MKEIIVTRGLKAIVDDEDFEKVARFSWHTIPSGRNRYAMAAASRDNKFWMHHFVFGKRVLLDHIDGNGLNNQKSNLRECTYSQNGANRRKNTKTLGRFKGVSFLRGKWMARLQVMKKRLYLGYFTEEIEAAKAYNDAAVKHFGEFAHINQI